MDETESLRDVLKHLMRRGAFQDLFGLPEEPLRIEVARTISDVRHGTRRKVWPTEVPVGRHARI